MQLVDLIKNKTFLESIDAERSEAENFLTGPQWVKILLLPLENMCFSCPQ